MFSGLIGYRGKIDSVTIASADDIRIAIRCEGVSQEKPEPKDSIAVNGVCLTATSIEGDIVTFDVIPETIKRSTLGALKVGDRVNLEYSLRVGDRLGGHFVYGHVDATAMVISRKNEGSGERVRIERPKALAKMIVEKAFVSVDGVSVTVADAKRRWFEIALIPETLVRTTLGERAEGTLVNIEVDPIARYAIQR
jgi:riboflavin synthase